MNKVLTNIAIFLVNFILIYFCAIAGIFADFLLLGKGASAAGGAPVFAGIFAGIQLIVLTVMFLRKKWNFHIAVYIACITLLIGMTYFYIYADFLGA